MKILLLTLLIFVLFLFSCNNGDIIYLDSSEVNTLDSSDILNNTASNIHSSFPLNYITDGISYYSDTTGKNISEATPVYDCVITDTMMIYFGNYDTQLDNMALMYTSLITGESGVFCFDPLCNHDTRECTAQIGNFGLVYYNGWIYTVSLYMTDEAFKEMVEKTNAGISTEYTNFYSTDIYKIEPHTGEKKIIM